MRRLVTPRTAPYPQQFSPSSKSQPRLTQQVFSTSSLQSSHEPSLSAMISRPPSHRISLLNFFFVINIATPSPTMFFCPPPHINVSHPPVASISRFFLTWHIENPLPIFPTTTALHTHSNHTVRTFPYSVYTLGLSPQQWCATKNWCSRGT